MLTSRKLNMGTVDGCMEEDTNFGKDSINGNSHKKCVKICALSVTRSIALKRVLQNRDSSRNHRILQKSNK